ncbi:MAG: cytochrome c [Candidatus Tectomicrobia bacterium]|nr:cytochrome c [Candidatus Tectomicrobia bacterium]
MKKRQPPVFFLAVVAFIVSLLIFRFGIRPPIPSSLFYTYVAATLGAILLWATSSEEALAEFVRPIKATIVKDDLRWLRLLFILLLPIVMGYVAYSQASVEIQPPAELRVIHPAPPASITVHGKQLAIEGLRNPLRAAKDFQAKKAEYLAEGRRIYFQNCFFCHGDKFAGEGHFAQGFNPSPANLADPGTIAQLQESYVFWRISKGGPGLPDQSTPWNSAMPAWENMLSTDEIWKVVLYIYEATDQQPRTWEAGHGQEASK